MDELIDPLNTNSNFSPKSLPNSTAVLVLGIVSIVGCFFVGIPGIICGIIAIVLHKKDKAIYETNIQEYDSSFKNSKAGFICGIIGLSLSAVYTIWWIVYAFFIVSVVSKLPHQYPH